MKNIIFNTLIFSRLSFLFRQHSYQKITQVNHKTTISQTIFFQSSTDLTIYQQKNPIQQFTQLYNITDLFTVDQRIEELLNLTKEMYAKEYEILQSLKELLQKEYQISFGIDEDLYLLLHLVRICRKEEG